MSACSVDCCGRVTGGHHDTQTVLSVKASLQPMVRLPRRENTMTRHLWPSALLLALAGTLQAQTVEFNRDIRPILADHCYACHGPDSGKRKAGLRLDTEAGAFAALDQGKPFVPGKPEQS